MKQRIGIMGCGWLGFPLAKYLLAKNYQLSGTTTTKANLEILEKENIKPYYVELYNDGVRGNLIEFLKEVDILIINIPPKRKNPEEDYFKKISQLYEAAKIMHLKQLIFVSSTSVYGDIQGEVNEKTAPKPKSEAAKKLFATEKLFTQDTSIKATVIRFGGLIGPDRHPATYLAGQKNLTNGDDAVNLIHLEDAIEIIFNIVDKNWWGKIINGVYPHHPLKKEYYTSEARKRGLVPPEYKKSYAGKSGKIVNAKTLNTLNFKFNHPIDSSF